MCLVVRSVPPNWHVVDYFHSEEPRAKLLLCLCCRHHSVQSSIILESRAAEATTSVPFSFRGAASKSFPFLMEKGEAAAANFAFANKLATL